MISTILEYMKGKDDCRKQWFNGVHLKPKTTNPVLSKQINDYDAGLRKHSNRVKKDQEKDLKL